MADSNHQVHQIKQGAQAWNAWREAHTSEKIDLRNARLGDLKIPFIS